MQEGIIQQVITSFQGHTSQRTKIMLPRTCTTVRASKTQYTWTSRPISLSTRAKLQRHKPNCHTAFPQSVLTGHVCLQLRCFQMWSTWITSVQFKKKKKKSIWHSKHSNDPLVGFATLPCPYLLVSSGGEGVLDRVGSVTTLFCAERPLVRRVAWTWHYQRRCLPRAVRSRPASNHVSRKAPKGKKITDKHWSTRCTHNTLQP